MNSVEESIITGKVWVLIFMQYKVWKHVRKRWDLSLSNIMLEFVVGIGIETEKRNRIYAESLRS